jgi:dynein heavy chain
LHKIIRDASVQIQDPSFNLMEFENSYVAQVGLLGIQLIWTKESEDALNLSKSDKKVMQNANQRFLDLLNMLIAVTTTNLTKIERVKFETLICIHVHQKDIFDELVRF